MKESGPQAILGFREILVNIEGLTVSGCRLFIFGLVEEGKALVGMDRSVLGSDFEGFVKIFNGFGVFTGGVEGFTEVVQGFGEVGLQLEGLPEKCDGLVVFLFVEMGEALVIEFGGFG